MNRPEEVRKEILLQLYACRPLALTIERIGRDASKQSYDYTQNEIGRELQFVADEGFAIEVPAKGTVVRQFRISPEGIRQFERRYVL